MKIFMKFVICTWMKPQENWCYDYLRHRTLIWFFFLLVTNWYICGINRSWPNLRHSSGICHEGLTKTTKIISQCSQCPDQYQIWPLGKYKSEILLFVPACSGRHPKNHYEICNQILTFIQTMFALQWCDVRFSRLYFIPCHIKAHVPYWTPSLSWPRKSTDTNALLTVRGLAWAAITIYVYMAIFVSPCFFI